MVPWHFGERQQLYPVAEFAGVVDVQSAEPVDALCVDLLVRHPSAEGEGRQQGDLLRCVDSGNVEMRVGLGISKGLGVLQDLRKIEAFVAHPAQNVVAGSVNDAGNGAETIGHKTLFEGTDHRDPSADARLEADVASGRGRGIEEFLPVFRQQGLVGRYHVLAGVQGFQQVCARRLIAAHQFHHDVDLGVVNDGQRIARYL